MTFEQRPLRSGHRHNQKKNMADYTLLGPTDGARNRAGLRLTAPLSTGVWISSRWRLVTDEVTASNGVRAAVPS